MKIILNTEPVSLFEGLSLRSKQLQSILLLKGLMIIAKLFLSLEDCMAHHRLLKFFCFISFSIYLLPGYLVL